jgi:simple sugar transport system ATP-binding protein
VLKTMLHRKGGVLSGGQQQQLAIARALVANPRFLILDEPTASLESRAIERLFERVGRVRASGVAILYISHHLEEIYEICDWATVLRDGRRVVSAPVQELDRDRLVAAMVGGELAQAAREQVAAPVEVAGTPRLRLRGVSVQTPLGSAEEVSLARGRSTRRSVAASATCPRTGTHAGSSRRSASRRT